MKPPVVIFSIIVMYLIVPQALLSNMAGLEARPEPSHACQWQAGARRLTVIDYFDLLPSVGIGGATRREKHQMLQAEYHPVIDVRHDYLLVHPDSSPAEQVAVFRSRNNADLIAASSPDFQSDYNDFTLYRLQDSKLRDVTREMLPLPPRTNRFLYELPRFGTTIRVFRFNLDTESRRHVFDLHWHEGRFVKVR